MFKWRQCTSKVMTAQFYCIGMLTLISLCTGNISPSSLISLLSFFFHLPLSALSGFHVTANCVPQCNNGGMCLRPQHCVCKPGSEGTACEQKTVPTHHFPPWPGNEPTNRHTTGHTNGHTIGHTNGHTSGHTNGHNVVPHRPIPQQVPLSGYASAQSPASNKGQMKLTVKPAPQFVQPHYIQQHIQQQ